MMKAYIAIKYHQDNRNRFVIEGISRALEQNGFETVCVARDLERWGQIRFAPDQLMSRSFAEIASSRVIVIDLTEKGVGLGIEAGFAFARRIPIVTVARMGADISATLQGISSRIFRYDDLADLTAAFSELPDQIRS